MRDEDSDRIQHKMEDIERRMKNISDEIDSNPELSYSKRIYLEEELAYLEEELNDLLIEVEVENFLESVDELLKEEGYFEDKEEQ